MDINKARDVIVRFIADYMKESAATGRPVATGHPVATGLVVGLSGGLDSAVSAALAVEALGKERVDAVALPCGTGDPKSLEDAIKIAGYLGLKLETRDIGKSVDAIVESCGRSCGKVRYGNIAARVRMIYLYDISAERKKLVLGTGNRSEALLGYTTLWGDMACAFTPLGGLYKTQVRKLAAKIGLPGWIIEKVPTAGLWQGQTDESEMGITYELADKILYGLFDLNKSPEELVEDGLPKGSVELVSRLNRNSAFKRRMPVFPELPGLLL